jgi:hypothetical protein
MTRNDVARRAVATQDLAAKILFNAARKATCNLQLSQIVD